MLYKALTSMAIILGMANFCNNLLTGSTPNGFSFFTLKIIDFLMNLKQYHVYRGTLSERLIKRIVSLMLTVLPLKFLQRVRYRIMTEYSSVETSCVCSTTSKYGYDKQIIDRAVYGEPVRTMFDGIEVNIPRQTETYLRILYGSNYMQLPPEEKRVRPQEVYIGK